MTNATIGSDRWFHNPRTGRGARIKDEGIAFRVYFDDGTDKIEYGFSEAIAAARDYTGLFCPDGTEGCRVLEDYKNGKL